MNEDVSKSSTGLIQICTNRSASRTNMAIRVSDKTRLPISPRDGALRSEAIEGGILAAAIQTQWYRVAHEDVLHDRQILSLLNTKAGRCRITIMITCQIGGT